MYHENSMLTLEVTPFFCLHLPVLESSCLKIT